MKKSKEKVKTNREEIISGIKSRLKGSQIGGLFVNLPDNQKVELRFLDKPLEVRMHFFQGKDGKWHRFVCQKRYLIGSNPKWKAPEDGCPICKYIEKLLEKDKTKTAERLKAQTIFVWNVINKNDPNNSEGELDTKIFEHKWQIFEGLGDIIEDREDFTHPKRGIGVLVKKVVKGTGKRKQTKYKTYDGSAWPLTDEEKALELKDLSKFYKFPDDSQKISSALGIDMEEYSENEDDDEEDDEDTEEEIHKKHKKVKKHKKHDDDEEEDEEEIEDEDLGDDDNDDEEEDEDDDE